jgi:glycerol-3-phosphate dehydrogenase
MESTNFDILVVGGGIIGAGIARDAALRGYSVALIEKNDFGFGTSSGSSKIVHAGLRYVAQKELRLVREGSIERKKILEMAPHITRPSKFLFPVYSDLRFTKSKLRLGTWVYDLLAGFRNHTFHKILNPEKARSILPDPIREENFEGAVLFGDGLMDDARLTLEVVLSAEEKGATVLNYCQAGTFCEDSSGLIKNVIAIDKVKNEIFQINAQLIVLACGHWTDLVIRGIDSSYPKTIRPTKGIHIITKNFYHKDFTLGLNIKDGRIFFVAPLHDHLLIGTTDTDYDGDLDHVPVNQEDVNYLIDAVNFLFPNALREEDVISAYSGLRPLVKSPTAKSESEISRKHEIIEIKPNVYAIVGGKFTTYRAMAKELVDRLCEQLGDKKKCKTDKIPLYGWFSTKRKHWENWATIAIENLTIRYQLPKDVAQNLLRYGKNYPRLCEGMDLDPSLKEKFSPDQPYTLAELSYFINYEKAITLNDVMFRRTQLQLSEGQGLGCAERVAEEMAKILNWSPEKTKAELENYKESLVWKGQRLM